ncbi:MAG: LCP family protein [Culicoidibacterales bacterium]
MNIDKFSEESGKATPQYRSRSERPQLQSRSRNNKSRISEKQPKKKRGLGFRVFRVVMIVFSVIVIALGVLYMTQRQKIEQISKIIDPVVFPAETVSPTGDTKGILVIGTDLSAGEESKDGYADSITYFAMNTATKHSAVLPIYRDARIPVTCNGNKEDNINRLIMKHNISCFAESTSKMLNLPVDYHVSITINGLETVIDKIGGIDVTPVETFSTVGRDHVPHSFTAGTKVHLDGATAIAYLRDRKHGNGEARANRQVAVILSIKNACGTDLLKCYNDVLPDVNQALRTNVPIEKISTLSALGNKDYRMKTFSDLKGTNTQYPDGWTQILDEVDKKEKTSAIRDHVFNK